MLEYREFKAAKESPLECVWELRGEGTERQRITPDGRFEFIFHLNEPLEVLNANGWNKQSATLVSGQLTQPLMVRPAGITHTVGVRLKSWAAAVVSGLPARELTNQVIGLRHIGKDLEQRLAHCIYREPDLARIAERLTYQLASGECADQRVIAAVEFVERTRGQCRVEQLAKISGLSFKQLQRLFDQHVGLGPKMFARIRRFSHVFAQLETQPANWAQIACECGYTDQSHLTRDFSQFAGDPPAALLSPDSDLAWCFTTAQRNDDFLQD